MKIAYRILVLALAAGALVASYRADEAAPPAAKMVKIEAQPANIALSTPYQYAQLLLTGVTESGDRIDVTRSAKLEAPPAAVTISPTGLVRPAADGEGVLTFDLAGQK